MNPAKAALMKGSGLTDGLEPETLNPQDIIRKEEAYEQLDIPEGTDVEEVVQQVDDEEKNTSEEIVVEEQVVEEEVEEEVEAPTPKPKSVQRRRAANKPKEATVAQPQSEPMQSLFNSWLTGIELNIIEACRDQVDIEGYTKEQIDGIWEDIIRKVKGE